LIHETSPYLLQHAHNPVHWYAWKEEAFQKAKAEDKPILVSIGYSTCHWCHVMERESFEDPDVAAFMNEHFINIKVDREERPDVDQIYMEACQAINQSGGWPLNCFLLPDGRPFYASTYFPPQPAYRRPSWRQVLENIAKAFRERRTVVEEQADQLTRPIKHWSTQLKVWTGISCLLRIVWTKCMLFWKSDLIAHQEALVLRPNFQAVWPCISFWNISNSIVPGMRKAMPYIRSIK